MMKKLLIGVFQFCWPIFFAIPLVAQKPEFTNSVGMKFVLIQPGGFTVGRFQPPYPKPGNNPNAGAESGRERGYNAAEYKLAEQLATHDAMPGFEVKINQPFYLGKFEITQAQWKKVMGANPSVFQSKTVNDDTSQYPVENITWQDAQAFLKKLTQMEGGKVTYRLPTEFEWEYAARAGAQDDISWEEIRLAAQMGTPTTNRVGQKKPNAWGLYDMLGNVWEWVQDYYNEKIFADPMPPRSGKVHVLKGVSFVGDVKNATYMTHAAGPGNGWDVGFRVVMEVK